MTSAPETRASVWRGRVVRLVVKGLLGFGALVALVLFGIDTGPGHRLIADQVGRLHFDNGMQLRIGRIDGSVYGSMVIHDLSVRDPAGEFLFVPETRVEWRPLAYLRGHIDVRSASAERMILRRVPQFRETPPSDAPLLPDLDIDIGRFTVASLIAEKPVSGERRVAAIEGSAHIADGRAQVRLDARSVAGRDRAGGDVLALRLDAVPQSNRLDLDLRLDAPADGVLAAIAGLSEPLHLKAGGKGDWRAWNGTVDADLGGQELARLALTARNGTFALRGPARPGRLASGALASLFAPAMTIDLAARLDKRRAELSGTVSGDALTLAPTGLVDFADNSFDQFRLAFGVLRPSALAPNLSGSGLRGRFVLDGPFAAPRVNYALNADRLAIGATTIERFAASGDASVGAQRILIPVTARIGRITGVDSVAGGTLAGLRLDGDITIEGERILSDNMRVRSARLDAGLVLAADMATGFYAGAIDGTLDDYRLESVAMLDVKADLDLGSKGAGFALAGKLRARSTRLLDEGVADFLGGNGAASADVRYGADGVVRFANLRVEAPLVRVTAGQGSYGPDGRLALAASGVSRAYGPVGIRVTGTLANPDAVVTAGRPGLGIGLSGLEAKIARAAGGYRLDARGQTDYGPFAADVTLGTGKLATILVNRAELGGIVLSGSLRRLAAGPFAGELTAKGQGVDGLVRLGARGAHQEVLVNLRARGTVLPGPARFRVERGIVDATIVLFDTPWIVADVQVAGARIGAFDIAAARAQIDYRGGRGTAKALVEASAGVPLRIAINADLEPKLWSAMLTGRSRGVDFRTASPARIIPGRGGYELLPVRITVGDGNVRLAGTYGDGLKLVSRMENVDLSLVNAFVPGLGIGGRATGSLDFAQAARSSFPSADARLSVAGFTRSSAGAVSQGVDINLTGKLQADGGEARAVFRRRGSVIGRMQASLRPLGPGGGDWSARLLAAPLGGGIRYNGPAETLFSFAGQTGQELSGPIAVAADFSCRLASPCLDGIVRANSLTYENHAYGTRLTGMAVDGRFAGERLEIARLSARAGSGSVEGKGFVSLAGARGYPMDMAFVLDNARLARGDDVSAQATGNLRLTKAAGETALLSGQLRLPETRYRIVRDNAAQVPQLSGVRLRQPTGIRRVTGDEPARPSSGLFEGLRLDIQLSAPDALYVSGIGLESEWVAKFSIGGTSAAPVMTGQFDLLRGTLGFAGRSFELVQGRINFTGGPAADPVVSVTGTEDVEGVSVNLRIDGRASNPQISLTSVPGLPQDEIMARILFGDSITNLSAIQAVQLAASLNALRASGGGAGPLGKLRSVAGIDRLRILAPDEANGRGTALAAGHYITNDIYVEVITDARGFTATQLEVALTRWLSLLSQAGGSGLSSVSVRIRKDY